MVERALRLGEAKDWAVVGAALCLLVAAIMLTVMWNAPIRHSYVPVQVVTSTDTSEIMVLWTRS